MTLDQLFVLCVALAAFTGALALAGALSNALTYWRHSRRVRRRLGRL